MSGCKLTGLAGVGVTECVGESVASFANLTNSVLLFVAFHHHSVPGCALGTTSHVVQVELVRSAIQRRHSLKRKKHV